MPTRERLIDRGVRLGLRLRQGLGEELRTARIGLGLSQSFVAHAAGLSQTQVSRMERGVLVTVSLDQSCRLASVLGLDVSVMVYPGGAPLRDQAQVDLIDRFRRQLGTPLRCRTEVPIPIQGDRRAWDVQILGTPHTITLEAETRIRDGQAVQRRIMLKARDAKVDQVILLVANTHANRAAIRAANDSFREMFPVSSRDALRSLRAGRDPGGWAIILL